MKLEVPVPIDVIERQSGRAIGLELRGDFLRHLPLHRRIESQLCAVKRKIAAETAVAVDQTRNFATVAHRLAVGQHDVKPDPKARQRPRPRHRIRGRRSADHEARRAQNTAPVRCFDSGVDRLTETEIVGRDDQSIQCASSRRPRRNEKNSTPSRNRRIIICGLRTISAMIEAIFGARK